MPKMKSRRGAAKRLRVNKNGKVRFKRAHLRHGLIVRTSATKRKLRATGTLQECDAKAARRMLPYG